MHNDKNTSNIELLLKKLEEHTNVTIEEGHEDSKEKIYIIYVKKSIDKI